MRVSIGIDYGRFTDRARSAMGNARNVANAWGHEYVGTEHLLTAIVVMGDSSAAKVLRNLQVDLLRLVNETKRVVQSGAPLSNGQAPLTPRARHALEIAQLEALNLGHNFLGTAHILLGLMGEGASIAHALLCETGVYAEEVREEYLEMEGCKPATAGCNAFHKDVDLQTAHCEYSDPIAVVSEYRIRATARCPTANSEPAENYRLRKDDLRALLYDFVRATPLRQTEMVLAFCERFGLE